MFLVAVKFPAAGRRAGWATPGGPAARVCPERRHQLVLGGLTTLAWYSLGRSVALLLWRHHRRHVAGMVLMSTALRWRTSLREWSSGTPMAWPTSRRDRPPSTSSFPSSHTATAVAFAVAASAQYRPAAPVLLPAALGVGLSRQGQADHAGSDGGSRSSASRRWSLPALRVGIDAGHDHGVPTVVGAGQLAHALEAGAHAVADPDRSAALFGTAGVNPVPGCGRRRTGTAGRCSLGGVGQAGDLAQQGRGPSTILMIRPRLPGLRTGAWRIAGIIRPRQTWAPDPAIEPAQNARERHHLRTE